MAQISTLFLLVTAFIGAAFAYVPYGVRDDAVSANVMMLLQYREMCVDLSGSDAGYRKLISSVVPAKDCVMRKINVPALKLHLESTANESQKELIDTYCPQLNSSLGCLDDVKEGMAMCMGGDTNTNKQIITEMLANLLEWACNNDGANLFAFQSSEFQECTDQLRTFSSQCKMPEGGRRHAISQYGEDECRATATAIECVTGKMDNCDSLKDLINAIFSPVSKANHCEKYRTINEITSNDIGENQTV